MARDGLLRKIDECRGVAASGNGVVVVAGEDAAADTTLTGSVIKRLAIAAIRNV